MAGGRRSPPAPCCPGRAALPSPCCQGRVAVPSVHQSLSEMDFERGPGGSGAGRAGDLGGGAGRGRGAGAAAAGAERGPRGARPGGVHGTALCQPERAPRGLPAAAGARCPVRCPHARRCHPAAPRLLLRAPRRHRAAAGTRSRPRRHRRRRQNRPAQGRRAGAPRALRPPPAPAPGSRRPPRCPGPQPAGRGAPGRVGPAGHLSGHGGDNRDRALSRARCPSRYRRCHFRVPPARPAHYPSQPITSRHSLQPRLSSHVANQHLGAVRGRGLAA